MKRVHMEYQRPFLLEATKLTRLINMIDERLADHRDTTPRVTFEVFLGRPQGRFLPFYTAALGLSLDALAFINIALCATKENKYPRSMLSRCFAFHTACVAEALQPEVVLLSGSGTHSFAPAFSSRMPAARVVPMLHYAHREGADVEQREHSRVREVLASVGARRV